MTDRRSYREPLAQEYTVIWHNPDRNYYVEGSGLENLGHQEWVAVVPVVPRGQCFSGKIYGEQRVHNSRTHIVRSSDGGKSWKKVSELPYYSAAPWQYNGVLYLFANKGGMQYRNDDLLLLKSEDGGTTWSKPVTLFEGHFWNAHTGMVIREHKLYWAIDDISFGMKYRGPRVVAGDLTGDIMDPASWRLSNPVPHIGIPESLVNPKFITNSNQYLEPNVMDVYGKLRVLATVKPKGQTTTGLCAVLDVNDQGEDIELSFVQYHPMPGGQLKFCVIRDEVSKLFWATVNLPADGQDILGWKAADEAKYHGGNDRRFLMLMYGVDGLNWFPAGCVAKAGKLSQSFMYPRLVIDGDDLGIISRTSVNAPNRHDADYATFHRIHNFRDLAMNLYPDNE